MKHIQSILIVILIVNTYFLQGQENTISNKNLLVKQINELKNNRNFITESNCNQVDKQSIIKHYESDFDKLIESLALAQHLISVSNTVTADNNIFNHAIAKNEGVEKLSTKEVIGKSRYPQLNFSYNNTKIEVRYRNNFKGDPGLISLKVDYPDNIQVYLDFTTFYQAMFRVYKKENYANGEPHLIKKIHLMFDPFVIGKINYLFVYFDEVERYRLRLDKYEEKEKISDYQYKIHNKYRYETYCYDGNDQWITATKTGNEIAIKPTTYLLWYKGTIGKYPIHLMLKRGFVKEEGDIEINDTIISKVQYAYDSQKKWINIDALGERQVGIFGFEGQDDSPEWSVNFEYNQILTGNWDNQNGKILPVKLTPMTKAFPAFTFKAALENELTPSGEVSNQSITALDIYLGEKKIQQINLEENKPNLEYFELGYVDINYDGFLDLIVDNRFFLYNPTTNKFDIPKDEEGEWEYIPNLTELDSYNPYTKSFTVQSRRSFIECRIINGKITPYESESYYPDEDGNMIYAKQKYINGKWKVIEEKMEEEPVASNSVENYALNIDLRVSNSSLLFTPTFYNRTGLEFDFKQKAKLFVEMKGADKKIYRRFLYDEPLSGEKENTFDDSSILFNGKVYFLEHYNNALIPFFPLNLTNGDYTFQLVLEHPLFGKVKSKSQQIKLPLALKKDTTIEHFIGNINNKLNGSIYFKVNDKKVSGTFINTKTGKNINLKGTYISGFFGADTINFEEYEKEDKLSGYFEGTINRNKGKNEGVFEGFWISPDRETRVPFTFKKQ